MEYNQDNTERKSVKLPWYKNYGMWSWIVIYTLFWPMFVPNIISITVVPFRFLRVQSVLIDYTSMWVLTFAWSCFLGLTYHLWYARNRYSDKYEYPKGFIPLVARAAGITFIAAIGWILLFNIEGVF